MHDDRLKQSLKHLTSWSGETHVFSEVHVHVHVQTNLQVDFILSDGISEHVQVAVVLDVDPLEPEPRWIQWCGVARFKQMQLKNIKKNY